MVTDKRFNSLLMPQVKQTQTNCIVNGQSMKPILVAVYKQTVKLNSRHLIIAKKIKLVD